MQGRRVRWWLLVPALALVLGPAWVLVTAWGPVLAGHPAYLVTLLAALAVGLVGLVPSFPPRGETAYRRVAR